MKYIISAAVVAGSGIGIYYCESPFVDFTLALLMCVAGFFLIKNTIEKFTHKNQES